MVVGDGIKYVVVDIEDEIYSMIGTKKSIEKDEKISRQQNEIFI